MYICNECEELFYEDEIICEEESYEHYYGVSDLFGSRNYFTLRLCPHCRCEDIQEYEEDEEEEIQTSC